MAAPTLLASTVMDVSASLLNDVAKSVYTYVAQIPYLNLALQELQEFFELNDVPVTATVSAVIQVNANVDHVAFSATSPKLPDDLIEPQILWERARGINPYTPMTKLDYLPRYMEGVQINQLMYYVWEAQEIRFLPANADNDIKMDYTRNLFARVTAGTDVIFVINGESFLEYRTAGLCAEFIGENTTRAQELNGFASLAMDRSIGISTKGRQAIMTRRRPFRNAYKRRVM